MIVFVCQNCGEEFVPEQGTGIPTESSQAFADILLTHLEPNSECDEAAFHVVDQVD